MSNGKSTRYAVMAPIHREGQEKTFWSRVGTAFGNEGKGGQKPNINVKLDSLPLGGEVVLFIDSDRDDDKDKEGSVQRPAQR